MLRFEFESYSAEINEDKISIYLNDRRYLVLRAGSGLNSTTAQDIDAPLSGPDVTESGDVKIVTWKTHSDLWSEKTYEFHFKKEHFWYQVKVKGNNDIRDLKFFDGAIKAHGYREWSYFDFSQFFTPECALLDQRYYKSMQYGCIDATTGQMSDRTTDPYASYHWIFTPPPLCYSLGFSSGPWLGTGVIPERGQYNFSRFEYYVAPACFCFRLTYEGMTKVEGEWESPKFIFTPAKDEYAALQQYCDTVRDWKVVNENTHKQADWWSKPLFCGWGEQNVIMDRTKPEVRNTQEWATQENYDMFVRQIKEKRLKPGGIVIDDKWQKYYGTCEVDTDKWPDLRGWIDQRHAEGYKVLLWFGACDSEGLEADECIVAPDGTHKCVDPTSPKYQSRIKEMMHRLLSPDEGCLDADGIKYDWTNWFPSSEGYKVHGNLWGIELLKSLTQQLYDASKEAKSDCMFITHTANPYFSECTDVIRLNDIHWSCREISSMMTHRAKIGRSACPHALIDCDNSSAPSITEWLDYMKLQPKLGIPSLYFLTGVDGTLEDITEEHWEQIADIWR